MKKSWRLLPKIASGQKVIESRWYLNRSAPWDKIAPLDRIYFKNSGEPISLRAVASEVRQFGNLTPEKVEEILARYGRADGLEVGELPHYYELFKNKHYCLLVFLSKVEVVEPFEIDKSGYGAMAAWITVSDINILRR